MQQLIDQIKTGILPNIEKLNKIEKEWYLKVSNFNIDNIVQDFAEEYIFHSPKNIQIKLHGINLYEQINFTSEEFELALMIICIKNEIKWNLTNPFVSFDYQGYRATIIHSSCLNNLGSKLFLRTKNKINIKIEDFDFSSYLANKIVQEHKNILIAGSTGSGKTTFINSLLQLADEDEHVIIAEDTFELASPHTNYTRFLSQDIEGYSLENYLSYAMRMRPDRIILGELRSYEVIPFLLALNTGHKGLMSTIHANDSRDAIKRIALLYKLNCSRDIPYEVILKLITQNIDHIIFLKDKKVIEFVNVLGSNKDEVFLEEIHSFDESPQEVCIN